MSIKKYKELPSNTFSICHLPQLFLSDGGGKNIDMEIHNSSFFPLYCCYVIIDADTESLVVLRHRKLIPLTQDFLLSAVLSFLSVHGCCIKTYLSDTLIESAANVIKYV